MPSTPRLFVSVAAVFVLAELAPAQNADQPLSGPKVTENKIPGIQEKFSAGGKGFNDKNGPRGLPPEAIKRALMALERDTSADAKLTDEQRRTIKTLIAEFESSVAAYRWEHKAEIDEVRKVLGSEGASLRRTAPKPASKPDFKPDPGQDQGAAPGEPMRAAPDNESVAAARATMEKLRRNAPNPADLQTRVWNTLTEPQRALVQVEAEKFVHGREEEKARDYVRKRMNKQDGPSGPDARLAQRPDGSVDLDTLPPRLRERLAKLTPAEREKALQRMRDRVKNSETGPRARKRPGSVDPDKPAPSMDEVPVPLSEPR